MQTITKHCGKIIFAAILALTISAAGASAATFTVTNTNDGGAGSLRQAVTDANQVTTADTIVFDASFNQPRTITLATEIRISPFDGTVDNLTITGPGANLLTVSGNSLTRIFFTIGNNTTSISGMTLTGGAGNAGGAIQNRGILTLTNIVFTNNTSDTGGAIYSAANGTIGGVLNLNGCTFTNNTATGTNINGDGGSAMTIRSGTAIIADSFITGGTTRGGGGGIRIEGGAVNITGSIVSNNRSGGAGNSDGGGGIFNSGELTLTNSTVSSNTAGEDTAGGGITSFFKLTLINSIVTGNTATESGGGISANGDSTAFLNITDSTVSNNFANTGTVSTTAGNGGGIYSTIRTTVTGSTVSGNSVRFVSGGFDDRQGNGGGIYAEGALTVNNSTFSGNSAGFSFGGIRVTQNFVSSRITNSTVVNNTSLGAPAGIGKSSNGAQRLEIGNTIIANNTLTGGTSSDVRNEIFSLGYNLIENTNGAFISGGTGDIFGVDPNLAPLADNGGATRTHALYANSPAIDAGDPATFPPTDQRGSPRPVDGNGDGTARADIGAYERQTNDVVASTAFDFDGDGRADISVYRPADGRWYLLGSNSTFQTIRFGLATDTITPADYDGDGRTDVAVFRDGVWYILQSSNGGLRVENFGQTGDIPRPGDFDGDGRGDVAVFRPSNGTWYRLAANGGFNAFRFGQNGDSPMLGDYDGDGRADYTVFRPGEGVWYTFRSTDSTVKINSFGQTGDIAVGGDFSGDGRADLAVYRPNEGTWYIARASGVPSVNFDAVKFGVSTDTPTPADYDGDGRTDIAVYRPAEGNWYRLRSRDGFDIVRFGSSGDKPVPSAFIR